VNIIGKIPATWMRLLFYRKKLDKTILRGTAKGHKKVGARFVLEFYVYGSVHHNIFYEITNRCSYMQSILFHC